MDRGQSFLRAWTLLAVFMLLSSMLTWSAIAAKPVLAAGEPTKLVFTTPPDASYHSTDTISITVEVQDADNVAVPDYVDQIHIALLNPGSSTLSGVVDLTPDATTGDADFSLEIHKVGTGFQLRATSGSLTADSSAFDVTSGNPNKLHFLDSDQPAGGTADQTFSTKVAVLDYYDNRVTSATNLVEFIPNPLVTIHGYAATNAVNGVASFSGLGIYEADTGYTLAASSSGLLGDTSDSFDITHGSPAKLVVSTPVESSYTADQDIAPVVRIEDDHDNLVTDGTGSSALVDLTLTGNGSGAALLGGSTHASGGIAEFTANVRKVGSGYGLDVSSGTLQGTSTGPFAITHATAAKLHFTVQPATHTADNTFGATVEVQDTYGNTITDGTGNDAPVTIGLNGPAALFTGTHTVSASGGVATFTGQTIRAANTGYSLTATSAGLNDETSSTFDVTHGVATKVVVTQEPTSTYTADDDITVEVTVQDAWNNTVTTGPRATASISLGLTGNGNGATLSGTSSKNASGGVASFTVNVRMVGSGYGLDATSAGLAADSTTTFNITPGALASFEVKNASDLDIGNQTAGAPFTIKATAYDAWGNIKTNYTGTQSAAITGDLGKALGTSQGNGDDTPPSFGAFGTWVAGVATASVTPYLRETGTTITVKDGTKQGTSNTFDVSAADASTIAYAVANNDRADPFNYTPISTKVGTPIYSACAPSGGAAPCATTSAGTPSKSVRVIVRDQYGNAVPSANITMSRSGTGTTLLSTIASDTNGIADFGETLSIGSTPGIGTYTLTARVVPGTNHPTVGAQITIVNELTACDNQVCQNNTNNGGGTKLQKSFGRIVTATDFFTGATTNVLLSTQFTDGTQGNQAACGNTGANKSIGNAVDMLVSGPGTSGTSPNSTMVLVMPKDTLKAFNITARGTSTFNICLGAKWIGAGSPPTDGWKARDVNSKKGGLIATHVGSEGRYWGSPADCGTPNLGTDPCIGLRTKQASVAQAYLHMSNADFALLGIKDSDLVVIIEKHSPWDGKGTLY